jgi:hypothetical protein
MCFIDFKKAFDMVQHSQVWLTMLDMGFPPHLVQLLRSLYKQQLASVRINNHMSTWFTVKKGVRQGCNMSPSLFNILAEQVMRKALEGYRGGFRIGGKIINNLRYADDIVLIATTPGELLDLVSRVEEAGKLYNMLINTEKTKVMTNKEETVRIEVEGRILEQVDSFTYLGSKLTKDADCSRDIKTRLAMGMTTMIKLTKMWKNKSISTPTKLRLMKVLVWPVATYGCETWTLKKSEEKHVVAFENKCIRKLMRISWTRLLTNKQVHEMAGTENMLLTLGDPRGGVTPDPVVIFC